MQKHVMAILTTHAAKHWAGLMTQGRSARIYHVHTARNLYPRKRGRGTSTSVSLMVICLHLRILVHYQYNIMKTRYVYVIDIVLCQRYKPWRVYVCGWDFSSYRYYLY